MRLKIEGYSEDRFHHLPDHQSPVELHGLSLREAFATIRGMSFGDIGGMMEIKLTDGSEIAVELEPTDGNAELMSSQHIVRRDPVSDKIIRRYKL